MQLVSTSLSESNTLSRKTHAINVPLLEPWTGSA
jgi:hypothetical protein